MSEKFSTSTEIVAQVPQPLSQPAISKCNNFRPNIQENHGAELIEEAKKEVEDKYYPTDACEGKEPVKNSSEKKEKNKKVALENVEFANEIKIDFIHSIDYRIMCRFLGIGSVNDIKNHPYSKNPLITLLLMQSLEGFMKSRGYKCVGELNFDRQGDAIPPEKTVWKIKNKELPFTSTSFKYFEKEKGKKKENVVFWLFTNLCNGMAGITCFTRDSKRSENVIKDLEKYTKANNCLRGAKLKDINMYACTFNEVIDFENYTWDEYYYPKDIKDLFKLEIFGFVKNVEKYNQEGIKKRGVIIFGKPGVGKTSIGYIICNNILDHTVIWITPEMINENAGAISSIKVLYLLADFVSPCVLILEDLDLYGRDRDNTQGDIRLGALMNVLDGVNSVNNAITIGTTNRIDCIEKALKNRPGRFDRIVKLPSLSKKLRLKMFSNRLKSWKTTKEVLNYIVENTKDWTGAESQELVNTLALSFIKNKKKKKVIDKKLVDEVINTLKKFGIGEKSGSFGFFKEKVESEN